jgi:pyruvate/oxaloacetate carboxyltransferase
VWKNWKREEDKMAADKIKVVDESLRDGSQSLWGMMMGYGMIEPVIKEIGEAGFHCVHIPVNVATPMVSVRFFKEDPRITFRMISEKLGNTKSAGNHNINTVYIRSRPHNLLFLFQPKHTKLQPNLKHMSL